MTTERDYPTLYVRIQLAPRGDTRWDIMESAEPFSIVEGIGAGGWCRPDDLWPALRRELPLAIVTWVHRLRRGQGSDNGLQIND